MKVHYALCTRPEVIGVSGHMLLVARKYGKRAARSAGTRHREDIKEKE